MANGDFNWIYLIFFLIPLARILPRMVRKWQNKNNRMDENQYAQNYQRIEQVPESPHKKSEIFEKSESYEKPLNIEMQVLGEINNGVKDFNQIQKNVGIDNQKLEKILDNFEENGLMRVVKKSGMLGNKIEMHPTEKGYKKFNI